MNQPLATQRLTELCSVMGVDEKWALSRRKSYYRTMVQELRTELKYAYGRLSYWQHARMGCGQDDAWFVDGEAERWLEMIGKLGRKISYYNNLLSGKEIEKFDVVRLKEAKIEDVAKHYGYQVKRTGTHRSFINLRNERTPSCCLYLDNQSFYDFGSGEGGDVITFVQKIDNCNFQDACRRLMAMGY